MECIHTPGNDLKQLFTTSEKYYELDTAFAHIHAKSDIFLPNDTLYEQLNGPEDFEQIAHQIFTWLGLKHRSLIFHIDPDQETYIVYKHEKNSSSVWLGWRCLRDPFVGVAAVAHVIAHHLLIARHKIILSDPTENESLTDLATIRLGLGVLVANSFGSNQPVLGALARENYAAELKDYLDEHSVVDAVWTPYIDQEILFLFQVSLKTKQSKLFIQSRHKQRAHRKHSLMAFGLTISVLIVSSFAAWMVTPKAMSSEALNRKNDASILLAQVRRCESTVKYKLAAWDTSDIFINRQIEADKLRCQSLRNRYNYQVMQYNSSK